jgi:hypothetical protein
LRRACAARRRLELRLTIRALLRRDFQFLERRVCAAQLLRERVAPRLRGRELALEPLAFRGAPDVSILQLHQAIRTLLHRGFLVLDRRVGAAPLLREHVAR